MIRAGTLLIAIFLTCCSCSAQQPTPVIDAVHKGHAVGHEQDGVNAVRAALTAGGNVNERDAANWTPLMHAALECRADIIGLLIAQGADVNARGKSEGPGFTYTGQTALLLGSGCFINRQRAHLAPERHMPAGYADYELAAPAKIVRALLAHGADFTATDDDGRTPLMMASMHGWPDVAGQLIKAGANVNVHDNAGRIAMDYADSKDEATISTLKQYGSRPATGHSGRAACDLEVAINFPIIDCIVGPGLIKAFQQQRGLPQTGVLDTPTLRALGIQ